MAAFFSSKVFFLFFSEEELQTELIDCKLEGEVIETLQVSQEERIEYLATIETFLTVALVAFQIKQVRSWFTKQGNPMHV